jgi:Na+/proline symporter
LTILGATSGPVVGLFFLGIFFPRANKNGAFFGLAISSFLMLALSLISNIEHPYRHFIITNSFDNNSMAAGCMEYGEQEMLQRTQMK